MIVSDNNLDLVLSSTDVSCYGQASGSVQSNVSGGKAPYTYSWDNGYSTPSISGLSVGTYVLTLIDDNGCVVASSAIINEPSELILDLDTVNVLCYDDSTGAIHSNIIGGTPTYTYAWNNGYTSPSINNLPIGTYSLIVTDGNGCSSIANAEVTETDEII